jgi:hypothetical protein
MKSLKNLSALIVVAGLYVVSAPAASAQVSVGIGVAPVCPYGYYDYAPYRCAPYGYYGPQWFNGGVFVGAGPWFRGPAEFHGSVDNHYDPQHGYKGPMPKVGEHYAPPAKAHAFKGNEERDGRGHTSGRG